MDDRREVGMGGGGVKEWNKGTKGEGTFNLNYLDSFE